MKVYGGNEWISGWTASKWSSDPVYPLTFF